MTTGIEAAKAKASGAKKLMPHLQRGWRIEDGGWISFAVSCACFRLWAEGIRPIHHFLEHRTDGLPGSIEFTVLCRREITTIQRVIQPRLRFHRFAKSFVNLVHERSLITTACPRFDNHRIHSQG